MLCNLNFDIAIEKNILQHRQTSVTYEISIQMVYTITNNQTNTMESA